jgi:hypothetical protein
MADFGSLLGAAGIGGAIGKAIVALELDTANSAGRLRFYMGGSACLPSRTGGAPIHGWM